MDPAAPPIPAAREARGSQFLARCSLRPSLGDSLNPETVYVESWMSPTLFGSVRGAPALPSHASRNFSGACLCYPFHGVGAFIQWPSKFPGTLNYTSIQSGWILTLRAPFLRNLNLRTGPFLPAGLAVPGAVGGGGSAPPSLHRPGWRAADCVP